MQNAIAITGKCQGLTPVTTRQLRDIAQKWKMPPPEWAAARTQFAVVFGDRFEINR
jgi:transposase-like protein